MISLCELDEILSAVSGLRVAVLGDGCADIYWEADMRLSRLSREAPHYPLPVVNERFSLGAGANAVANLAAFGVKNINYVCAIGRDWRGKIFEDLLDGINVSPEYLIKSSEIITPAYCKPVRSGISEIKYEDPRLDFANLQPFSAQLENDILQRLKAAVNGCDILIVCDQFEHGCVTPKMMEYLSVLGESVEIVVDSRSRIASFKNAILKPNEVEAENAACQGLSLRESPKFCGEGLERLCAIAATLEEKSKRPVVITLGGRGAIWCEHGECLLETAFDVAPPIDFVGAGDSFLAGLCAARALKSAPRVALSFASLVSAVTIKKLGTTGTACKSELRAALKAYSEKSCVSAKGEI